MSDARIKELRDSIIYQLTSNLHNKSDFEIMLAGLFSSTGQVNHAEVNELNELLKAKNKK